MNSGYVRAADSQAHARWLLADQASRTLSKAGGNEILALADEARVVHLLAPVGNVEPLRWLREQRLGSKFYWSGRGDGMEIAAVGVADLQESDAPETPATLHKRLAHLLHPGDTQARPRTRYYGGLRFDTSRESGKEWEAFGAYRFVLPRFELRRESGESTLVCNLVLPDDVEKLDEVLGQIERLNFPLNYSRFSDTLPRPIHRTDTPDLSGWTRNIECSLSGFEEGRLDKVVLARRAEFEFEEDVDPALLVERLKATTSGCFHFYVEPEEEAAFVGASPERLFRREGYSIWSEAVAGTRPRGVSDADDDELRDELLGSAKDLSEHSYVKVSIEETLRSLCDDLEVEETTSEMKLARGRHLVSQVRGTLREGVTDAEVLEALHPTPAVGGYPNQEALEEIQSLETFDRGWYAGPIGWIGADEAEFAVGIRSGLLRGRNLALYSGAGIVAGSTPEGEWAEIEQKIGDFTRVFGLEPTDTAT